MRPNALISIGLALVLAVGALLLGRAWLQGEQARQADPGFSTVVVANKALGFGQRLTQVDVKQVRWPAEAVPPGAFRTIADLKLETEARAVLQPIAANEPVLATRVTGPEQRATLSAVLEPGMRAFSIRANDVVGVGGFLLPNDRVDVILVRAAQTANTEEEFKSELLIQNVRVLGIDQEADASADKPKVAKAVTLEVTPRQAQILGLASLSGTLTLALRNPAETDAAAASTVTMRDLKSAGAIAAAAPPADATKAKARPAKRRAQAKAAPAGAGVTVVRGDAATTVTVRRE
jgi:pilus assembly protein CpaB